MVTVRYSTSVGIMVSIMSQTVILHLDQTGNGTELNFAP